MAGIHKETKKRVGVKIAPVFGGHGTQEIAVMKLLDHPHLQKLYDVCVGEVEEQYLFLEACPGGTLIDRLLDYDAESPPQLEMAIRWFREIIYGVEYMHSRNICHRNLSLETIFLDENDHIKISDFEYARWTDANVIEAECGNPHYSAPEICRSRCFDRRAADIWSCGVILYSLVSRRHPFTADSVRQIIMKTKKGLYEMPDSPEPIQDLIARMLQVDVNKRITIKEIKQHPAFRMYLPQDYCVPTPIPVPAAVITQINPEIVQILRAIGYNSEEDVTRDLTASEDTAAKMFYAMWQYRETLPWKEIASEYSVSRPLAAPAKREDEDADTLLKNIMTQVQKWLSVSNFKWVHPDQARIFATPHDNKFVLEFKADYTTGDNLTCVVEVRGNINSFAALADTLESVLSK